MGLKLNGTHHFMAYADDVTLLEDNIDTIKKDIGTLIDVSKEVGLDVSAEETEHIFLSRHLNAGQNHDIKEANQSLNMWHSLHIWGCQ
jgi:hypothetical protein